MRQASLHMSCMALRYLTCAVSGLVRLSVTIATSGLPDDWNQTLSTGLLFQAHADEAEGPAAALSQAVAAATALGTVGDSEEPDTGLTLSQHKASTYLLTRCQDCWAPAGWSAKCCGHVYCHCCVSPAGKSLPASEA